MTEGKQPADLEQFDRAWQALRRVSKSEAAASNWLATHLGSILSPRLLLRDHVQAEQRLLRYESEAIR
jgi:hypothetical protein